MKIKGFYCPCVGRTVAPDHYSSFACSDPPMGIAFILGWQNRNNADKVHRDNQLSASRLTHCTRATAIEDNIPVVVDIRDVASTNYGTAIHDFCQKWAPPGLLHEVEFPLEGQPKPVLFEGTKYEVTMRGTLDVLNLSRKAVVLEDYKTTGEWSQKFRFERGQAEMEWNVQASVYKILAARCAQIDIKQAVAWSIAQVGKKSKAPAWLNLPITFLSEEEILDVTPFDGDNTVGDYILAHKEFVAKMNAARAEAAANGDPFDPKPIVAEVPLFGKTAKRFDVCSYCNVRDACTTLAGGVEW